MVNEPRPPGKFLTNQQPAPKFAPGGSMMRVFFVVLVLVLLEPGLAYIQQQKTRRGSTTNVVGKTRPSSDGPYIDLAKSGNVTALLDKTSHLNCRVKRLGNKTVSWIRHRDIHLLTVGHLTYTNDQRFRPIHQTHSEDWTLEIKSSQHRDSGVYECQISTTPHTSHFIFLQVVEPATEILGGPDLFINKGSTINLTCIVTYSPEPPNYIFWNHDGEIISYDSSRGGVTVITEKDRLTRSYLLIQRAVPADSGKYTCNPSNAAPKTVTVHVLDGEHPAAMQGGGAPEITSHVCLVMVCIVLTWSRGHMS